MAKTTKTQIKEYLNWLDDDFGVVKQLYKKAEEAYLLTLHDTLSDEFQIVADILDVFSKKTEARLTLFAPDRSAPIQAAPCNWCTGNDKDGHDINCRRPMR